MGRRLIPAERIPALCLAFTDGVERLPQGTVEGDQEKLVSMGHLKKMAPKTKGVVVYASAVKNAS
jgi:hypothetical protein